MPIHFRCSLTETAAPLTHCWEHVVGSGHAPLALRADWQAQLKRCHDELGFKFVRFHGLLSDDMGTVICHNEELLYSFFNIDQIFDFLLSVGMKPFVELSFMPQALAAGNKTVFSYAANVTPPREYSRWGELITKLAKHCIERYGVEEVRQWFFEVWNEPNLESFWDNPDGFWRGAQAEYFKLYQTTVTALKEVDDKLRVGGPATAKNEWIAEFLDFCEKHELPADFVSTHHYPTDAFGDEGDDTLTQLASSRRGVLREQAQDAGRQARGRLLYYTEWNASSNPRDPLHDEPYAAAFIAKTVMETNGIVAGYGFWTFTDIFEENYFPSVPFHGGFGLLNLYGIPKPTYRAYQLMHRLGQKQLMLDGIHATVNGWAARRGESVTFLLTNHALPHHPIETEKVHLTLADTPQPVQVSVERIDQNHANAKRLWCDMGEPEYLSTTQVEQLLGASELQSEPLDWHYESEAVHAELDLPPHAVAAVTLNFAPAGKGGAA